MVPGTEQYEGMKQDPTYRPIRNFSLYIDSFLWKLNAGGYHFTNILLNALAYVLVYYFIGFFFKDKLFSFLIAVLFVLHPVHVETVIWIKNRAELIAFIFFILSSTLLLVL